MSRGNQPRRVPNMLIALWSAKGGAGTTVVATSVALTLGQRQAGVVIADLAGDVPAVLGAPEPDSPGLAAWLHAGEAVPVLERLEVRVARGLALLPRGTGPLAVQRSRELAAALQHCRRHVIADCGTLRASETDSATTAIARAASHSWIVIRPDYLSLRHATNAPAQPTGAVVVQQPGRALGPGDIERVLNVPVLAQVDDDPAVARAVDAGLLSGRLPQTIKRGLRPTTDSVERHSPSPHVDAPTSDQPPEASL